MANNPQKQQRQFHVESYSHSFTSRCGHVTSNYTYYGKKEELESRLAEFAKTLCHGCFLCPPKHHLIYFFAVIKGGDKVRLDGDWYPVANNYPELIGKTVNDANRARNLPLARPL